MGAARTLDDLVESPRALPSEDAIRMYVVFDFLDVFTSPNGRWAYADPEAGTIFINRGVWDTLTPGQQATVYWEEIYHLSRYIGLSKPNLFANGVGYKTPLGNFLEEFFAHRFATQSNVAAFDYAWNYDNRSHLSKWGIWVQGSGILSAGYWVGDWLTGDDK